MLLEETSGQSRGGRLSACCWSHLVASSDCQLVNARIEGDGGDGPHEVVRVDALARVHIPQPHLWEQSKPSFLLDKSLSTWNTSLRMAS